MRTIQTTVYTFEELSDEAKETALNECREYNVDYAWYEQTEEDAKNVGLDVREFNIDRRTIRGEFTESACYCAEKITTEHGDQTDTYKTAASFLEDWKALVAKFSDGENLEEVDPDLEYEFDLEADDLENDFRKAILEDYLSILSKDYDYLVSDEAVKECILANEYEFTEDGKRA